MESFVPIKYSESQIGFDLVLVGSNISGYIAMNQKISNSSSNRLIIVQIYRIWPILSEYLVQICPKYSKVTKSNQNYQKYGK